jgi:hypothetical protein
MSKRAGIQSASLNEKDEKKQPVVSRHQKQSDKMSNGNLPKGVQLMRFQVNQDQDYRVSDRSHDGVGSANDDSFWIQIAAKAEDSKRDWSDRFKVSYKLHPIGINGYWFQTTSGKYFHVEFFM